MIVVMAQKNFAAVRLNAKLYTMIVALMKLNVIRFNAKL